MKDFIKTRRIITIFVAVLSLIAFVLVPLTSCNSEGFTGVHIQNENGEVLMCRTGISSYAAFSNGVYTFKFSDGTSVSTRDFIAFSATECPICNGGE